VVTINTTRFLFGDPAAQHGPGPPHSWGFYITHNDAPKSVGHLWTSDQRRRDLYLITYTQKHKRQTSIPPVAFEPRISAGERPQTYAFERAANGTGITRFNIHKSYVLPTQCFVWIWEQTAIISLYSINWLVFINETECVYCTVRAGSLYITLYN
jgi:hypothetical protein